MREDAADVAQGQLPLAHDLRGGDAKAPEPACGEDRIPSSIPFELLSMFVECESIDLQVEDSIDPHVDATDACDMHLLIDHMAEPLQTLTHDRLDAGV